MQGPDSLCTPEKAQPRPVALFVSDVHLQSALPNTTAAFIDFLRNHAIAAANLYLLGDLFEYWAGDDDIASEYNAAIVQEVRRVSEAGTKVFWVAGNRDFLAGEHFAQAAGLAILADPTVIELAGLRIVLTHGDAQCTDDLGYMQFRAQVRSPQWQEQFLALPLAQRKAIIEGMRSGSREAQRDKSYKIMDVNPLAIEALFENSKAGLMIHGHTHHPARHELDKGKRLRYVLPDWDCDASSPARGGWLALMPGGKMTRFDVHGMPQV